MNLIPINSETVLFLTGAFVFAIAFTVGFFLGMDAGVNKTRRPRS